MPNIVKVIECTFACLSDIGTRGENIIETPSWIDLVVWPTMLSKRLGTLHSFSEKWAPTHLPLSTQHQWMLILIHLTVSVRQYFNIVLGEEGCRKLRRFLLDVQAVSANKKVTKEILTTHEYFEPIWEETRLSNNLAAKLTPWEKFQSQVTHKGTLCVSSKQNGACFKPFLWDWTSLFSRMIQGSLRELNYSEVFQIVFKMLTYNAECFGN